jgi:hypothetical protein
MISKLKRFIWIYYDCSSPDVVLLTLSYDDLTLITRILRDQKLYSDNMGECKSHVIAVERIKIDKFISENSGKLIGMGGTNR